MINKIIKYFEDRNGHITKRDIQSFTDTLTISNERKKSCSCFEGVISIIMPVYNQVHYIERSILSILNQDYSNIELILIDGGSEDGTLDIIKKYNEYIYYWVSEPDNGQAHALNKGIDVATGEYIGWQNSDDIYLPNAFEYLRQAFSCSPEIVTGNAICINNFDNILSKTHFVKPYRANLLYEGMVMTSQAFFWNRKKYINMRFDEKYHHAMDYDFWLRLMDQNSYIIFINQYLGAFRIYPGTKTEAHGDKGNFEVSLIRGKNNVYEKDLSYKIKKNILRISRYIKYLVS